MGKEDNGFEPAEILVVDANMQFVEYVSPAVARRALKDGYVTVFRKQPFSVQLPPGVDRCPNTFAKARRAKKEGSNTMSNPRKFTDFFREEKDVYVKALVPGQVSLGFELSPGNFHGITVPFTGDPICLSDQVPWDAIKNSMDLRKLCNPRRMASGGIKPAAIELLTEEEVQDHWARKAKRRGMFKKTPTGELITDPNTNEPIPDIEAISAPKITEPVQRERLNRVPDGNSKSQEAMDAHSDIANVGKEGKIMMHDAIHPRVLHLCNEVSQAETDASRMSANELLDELERLGDLSEDSLNHILAFGYYKSVKTWATQMLAEVAASEPEEQ